MWLQITLAFIVSLINVSYLCRVMPFEDRTVQKLEVMNEMTNLILLYHLLGFAGLIRESEDRYKLGWLFCIFIAANMLVHFTLLIISTLRSCKLEIKKKCAKKPPKSPQPPKELSVIYEEDEEFWSNHSSKRTYTIERERKLTDSDWQESKFGGSDVGWYNLAAIKWTDLGRKFTIKRGKKSLMAEHD